MKLIYILDVQIWLPAYSSFRSADLLKKNDSDHSHNNVIDNAIFLT